MASDFPATVTAQIEHGSEVLEFIPSQTAGEVAAKSGELVFFDTADQKVKRCGANPALILGVAEVVSESARVITPNGKVPIRVLKPNALVRMCSATTPLEAHRLTATGYDIVRLASGNWAVNIASTANPRVQVKEIDIPSGAFFVSFFALNLQGDLVAS